MGQDCGIPIYTCDEQSALAHDLAGLDGGDVVAGSLGLDADLQHSVDQQVGHIRVRPLHEDCVSRLKLPDGAHAGQCCHGLSGHLSEAGECRQGSYEMGLTHGV